MNFSLDHINKSLSLSHFCFLLPHPYLSLNLFFLFLFPLLSFREAISKGSKMPPHWPYSLVHGKQSHILHPHRLCLLTMVLLCVPFQDRKPAPFALYISQVEVRNHTTASSNSQGTVEVLHMEVNEAPAFCSLMGQWDSGLMNKSATHYKQKSYLSDLPTHLCW